MSGFQQTALAADPIEVVDVQRTFRAVDGREVSALQDMSISIRSGEFVCFIGPSGCGKSTLLNMLAGLEGVDGGSITIGGEKVQGPNSAHAMVFQEYALFPWMTVLDNIKIGLRYQGKPRRERDRRARTLVELMGLGGFETAYPKELSGGMKQRVALARAYATDPSLLLMDEPFGALDAQTKTLLQEDLLDSWSRRPRTVVFVTHDVDEAVFLSQRVVVFSRRPGRVYAEFQNELPYPRDRATRSSQAFFELRSRVWETVYSLVDPDEEGS